MRRISKILSIMMSIVMLMGISINVNAETGTSKMESSNGKSVLNNYTNMLAKTYCMRDLSEEQQNELRCDLLRDCKDELIEMGYEAYLVDSDSYNQTEQVLNTDLSEMGMKDAHI